jgi:hypothetical protein
LVAATPPKRTFRRGSDEWNPIRLFAGARRSE